MTVEPRGDKPRPRSIREDAVNLPNLLTMFRVVLIPVVLFLLDVLTRRVRIGRPPPARRAV